MSSERMTSGEVPRREIVNLSEWTLGERNTLQAELACYAYDSTHKNEDVAAVKDGTKMLWWIQKGFAKVYGDLDEIDVGDKKSLAEQIIKETIH
jgi:hypothetical protein